MKVIEITVSPKGETKVQTKGFTGPSCLQASKLLEQALGAKAGEHRTAEFYQAQNTDTCQRERTG